MKLNGRETYLLPVLVIIISVPSSWNFSHKSLVSNLASTRISSSQLHLGRHAGFNSGLFLSFVWLEDVLTTSLSFSLRPSLVLEEETSSFFDKSSSSNDVNEGDLRSLWRLEPSFTFEWSNSKLLSPLDGRRGLDESWFEALTVIRK